MFQKQKLKAVRILSIFKIKMSFRNLYETEFLNEISKPLGFIIRNHNKDIETYKSKLMTLHYRFVGVTAELIKDNSPSNIKNTIIDLNDMIHKTNYAISSYSIIEPPFIKAQIDLEISS
jgi:hypothetical protein